MTKRPHTATEIPPPPPDPAPGPLPAPSLHRSRSHRVVAGVARGIAERYGVAPWVVRTGFIALCFCGRRRSPPLSGWLAADPRGRHRQVASSGFPRRPIPHSYSVWRSSGSGLRSSSAGWGSSVANWWSGRPWWCAGSFSIGAARLDRMARPAGQLRSLRHRWVTGTDSRETTCITASSATTSKAKEPSVDPGTSHRRGRIGRHWGGCAARCDRNARPQRNALSRHRARGHRSRTADRLVLGPSEMAGDSRAAAPPFAARCPLLRS